MSGTINKVILIGHIGDDIKMHYFDGGGCLGSALFVAKKKSLFHS